MQNTNAAVTKLADIQGTNYTRLVEKFDDLVTHINKNHSRQNKVFEDFHKRIEDGQNAAKNLIEPLLKEVKEKMDEMTKAIEDSHKETIDNFNISIAAFETKLHQKLEEYTKTFKKLEDTVEKINNYAKREEELKAIHSEEIRDMKIRLMEEFAEEKKTEKERIEKKKKENEEEEERREAAKLLVNKENILTGEQAAQFKELYNKGSFSPIERREVFLKNLKDVGIGHIAANQIMLKEKLGDFDRNKGDQNYLMQEATAVADRAFNIIDRAYKFCWASFYPEAFKDNPQNIAYLKNLPRLRETKRVVEENMKKLAHDKAVAEKLRCDRNLQDVRAKIFPYGRNLEHMDRYQKIRRRLQMKMQL